ncbi:MAG: TonB family protein [Alistipes sp.]|nr:TonB family protein [Alistipes sp.]
MWDFILYLGQSAVCLAALYLLYKATMSYETLHRLNRVVLLGSVMLAAVLPLCHIKIEKEIEVVPQVAVADNIAMNMVVAEQGVDAVAVARGVVVALFLLGAAVMVARLVMSQLSVWRVVRSGEQRPLDGDVMLSVVEKLPTPFSWFSRVVVDRDDEQSNLDLVLEHELAHIRLHHSWDVLAVDIALCVWWFNPALWLLRRELQSLHEYQADDAVLRRGIDAKTYQILLIKRAVGSRLHSVANCLNHSNLKNRITMMCKKNSSRWSAAKLLLVLPLVAISLAATATTVYVPKEQNKGNENFVETQIATADEEQPYIKVQQMPTFQGGDLNAYRNWMQSQLQYPKEAKDKGIKGRVIFSFVVEKDGSVSEFKVLNTPDKLLSAEVERVFKLTPKWEAGEQNGKEVRVKFTVPIVFTGDDVAVYNRVFSQGTPLSEMSKDAESAVGEVSGRVIDAKTKKPISDVILLINGAGVGTHSDASGRYSLKKLPEGKYTFVASCVGYKSVKKDFEVSSKKSAEVNFELEEQAVAVAEIVVDKNKTAAQNESNVKNTKLEKGDIVEMTSTTGESMPVKYVGDFASALVMIDGKEGKIENIGVDDIESFTILKDEQATNIYGEKGKNGVVLITTKKAAQVNKQQSAQEEAFIKVESMPTFQGGDLNGYRNWVQSQLLYPAEAKEKGIKGRVIFSFVVEKDGSVSNFDALQAPDKILVDEVERVFKLTPKWEPGKQNGKAVRVKYTVPIYFNLEDAATATTVQLEVGSKAKAHFDIGLSFIKQADALQEKIDLKAYGSNTEFRSLQKEITDKYLDAVPELEKAYELAPNYKPIVETLKLLTFRLRDENGMMAKYEKYKKAFDLVN